MQQVNWTALNRALCEALKVPTFTVPSAEIEGLEEVRYPYIVGVDALLPLLAARGFRCGVEYWQENGIHHANMGWVFTHPASRQCKYAPISAHALALAAATALNVEVPYAD